MKEVGKLWKSLDTNAKREFELKALIDKQRFLKDMEIFEKELNSKDFGQQEEKAVKHNSRIPENFDVDIVQDIKTTESNASQFSSNESLSDVANDDCVQETSRKRFVIEKSQVEETNSSPNQIYCDQPQGNGGYGCITKLQPTIGQILSSEKNGESHNYSKPFLVCVDQGEAVRLADENEQSLETPPPLNQISNILNKNLIKEKSEIDIFEKVRTPLIEPSQMMDPPFKFELDADHHKEDCFPFPSQTRFSHQSRPYLHFEEYLDNIAHNSFENCF